MLRQLRKKKTMKRLLWALAILIIPPFVFWGGGSALRSMQKGPAYAGLLFGKKVSFEEYGSAWQAVRDQAIMMYGTRVNEVLESLDLERQAWERLMLIREAKKRRIRVSDAEVITTIGNFPFFQSNGKFDKQAYDLILKQIFRVDSRQFEEEIRDFLAITKLRDTILKDVKISDEEVKTEYKKENEKLSIAYILVSPDDFKKTLTIDEGVLKKYYQNNVESFRMPEQINIDYLGFEFADYQKDIQISDEEVTTYYEERKEEFDPKKEFKDIKDMIKNRMIQEKAQVRALEAAEKIDYTLADKTKTIEDVAKEKSLQIKETGFFAKEGIIPQIGWFPEIQRAAFQLKIGDRSELIKSKTGFAKGFYIIRIKEKRASYIPAFEEVKGNIENILKDEQAIGLASQEADRLYKKIIELMKTKNMKFQEAASSIMRAAKLSESFARNGYVQGIGLASELGEDAFNKKIGEVAPVAKTRAGFCIFTVVEITPIDEEKFRTEKEEFTKKALEEKRSAVLNEWYFKLLKEADIRSNITEK